jgi:predicted ATPase
LGLDALEATVPDSLRQLIEQQLVQCSPAEQRVLEAAGVAGMEWAVAAVAAGLNGEMLEVEEQCVALALRAAMNLARLWQQQGKRTEAHERLAPVYDWFTEGLDTADLQEAKALLEALA